ncbi:MAG: MBL fold hydrolase [Draconibacterium sp.]|nr:MAG: MBL fold hydrolase [Draconibacterium sp.]
MIRIDKFVVNQLGENSLVVSDESGECIFIDPGFYFNEEKEEISTYISENKLRPVKIVNTHCHFDHVMGVEYIRRKYQIPFVIYPDDEFLLQSAVSQGDMFGLKIEPLSPPDAYLSDKEEVTFGNTKMKVFHVPGHSPGHVVFYHEKSENLIAGDVLFNGSIGRTDLPGGNYNQLVSGIKEKLLVLPAKTRVYCGHGPETTIGFEKNNNPFLN